MTTKSFLFYTCLLLTIMITTACSNEEITSKDFNHDTDIEQKMLLNELGDFTTYYINSIYRFYDPRLDYIDLDSLNLYMLQYKFQLRKHAVIQTYMFQWITMIISATFYQKTVIN